MFDIEAYLKDVELKLSSMTPEKRVAFVVWVAEPLLTRSAEYLTTKLGQAPVDAFRSACEFAASYATTGERLTADAISRLRESAMDADWDDDGEDDAADASAMEALEVMIRLAEVLESDSARSAAEAAERAINQLDFEIGMTGEVNDPFASPRMRQLLDEQQTVLRELQAVSVVPVDFRSRWRSRP
jgi:hypothetical protein